MAYPSDISAVLDPSERQIYDALTLKGVTRLKEREREQADRARAFRAQINAAEARHPKYGRGWLQA